MFVQQWQYYQLSQRDRAAGSVIVLAKSERLELAYNILRTLYAFGKNIIEKVKQPKDAIFFHFT